MKKIILLVEDSFVETKKAKEVLFKEGFKFVVASTLADAKRLIEKLGIKISGIITDIHIPENENDVDTSKPCGLAVIARATSELPFFPVVICSDVNHHHAEYLEEVIKSLNSHVAYYSRFGEIPFIMDSKNWEKAVEELKKLIGGDEE